jgi:large subunit ribosomal protein L6
MSLIGKKMIKVPSGVSFSVEGSKLLVVGPKGTLEKTLPDGILVEKEGDSIKVATKRQDKRSNVMHGTYRSLVSNMVNGVSSGWDKRLELVGTGYRAEVSGTDLVLTVGHSHPIRFIAPAGINFKVEKSDILISGIDREIVGNTAAKIRMVRPPDPYKGKGIKYKDEVIRRKAGKAAKTAGGAA